MRWPTKEDPRYEWHKWFAWYPITIGLRRVWLETILRKKYRTGGEYKSEAWEYKDRRE